MRIYPVLFFTILGFVFGLSIYTMDESLGDKSNVSSNSSASLPVAVAASFSEAEAACRAVLNRARQVDLEASTASMDSFDDWVVRARAAACAWQDAALQLISFINLLPNIQCDCESLGERFAVEAMLEMLEHEATGALLQVEQNAKDWIDLLARRSMQQLRPE